MSSVWWDTLRDGTIFAGAAMAYILVAHPFADLPLGWTPSSPNLVRSEDRMTRLTILWPYIVLLCGGPLISSLHLAAHHAELASAARLGLNAAGVFMIFNIVRVLALRVRRARGAAASVGGSAGDRFWLLKSLAAGSAAALLIGSGAAFFSRLK